MKAVLTVTAVAAISCSAFSQGLFDVNFQSADQEVNQIVTTGARPDHISAILFGAPTVVQAYGTLTDQPLRFDSNNETPSGPYYYSQIQLTMPNLPMPMVGLSFDMIDTGLNHSFTLLFDTPEARNFYFDAGQISFRDSQTIGTYQMDQVNHFNIQIDYFLNQWSFAENNKLLATGAFNPAGDLQSIRFNYSADGPDISGTAIDNVVVVVPEPSTLSLLVCAGCLLVVRLSYTRKNLTT